MNIIEGVPYRGFVNFQLKILALFDTLIDTRFFFKLIYINIDLMIIGFVASESNISNGMKKV